MKKIILLSVWGAALLMAVSCGQTDKQQQQQNVASDNVQAVEEINIPEEVMQAEVEEVPAAEAETTGTAIAIKPKKSENENPAPTPSKSKEIIIPAEPSKSAAKPAPEPEKKVVVVEKITDDEEIKSKGSNRIRNSSLPTKSDEITKEEVSKSGPSHDVWNSLLVANVTSTGSVNYGAIKKKQEDLDAYLKLLADNPVENSWSRNEKMAYWINLYNASTVKLIVANYPTKSIQNLENGKPWDKKWIKSGGKTYTLNEIENSILRPQFKDARIHFAVNCAAQSCPRLMNKAFTAANLESLLEQSAKSFINSNFNKISANKIEISKIFKWYEDDFGNIIEYLNKYSTAKINADAKITYLEYNWDLNGK